MVNCYLVETTELLIKCAEILIEHGYYIEGIISPDYQIHKFAEQKHISCFHSINDSTVTLKNSKFDCLFIIANTDIIPPWLLHKPSKLVINYYEVPLQTHSGMHTESWVVLLSNERRHEIRYEVDQKLDVSQLIKQVSIPIYDDNTESSLNLRCYECAIKAFKETLSDLVNDNLEVIASSTSDDTLFMQHSKTLGGEVVHWGWNTAYIIKLSISLYSSSDISNETEFKIILPKNLILYPSKIEVVSEELKLTQIKPGTVISISQEYLAVSCKDGIIRMREFYLFHDHQISLNEIKRISAINECDTLPLFSQEELQFFTYSIQDTGRHINLLAT